MDKIEPWNMLWEWFEYVNEDNISFASSFILWNRQDQSFIWYLWKIYQKYIFKGKNDDIPGDYYVMNIFGTKFIFIFPSLISCGTQIWYFCRLPDIFVIETWRQKISDIEINFLWKMLSKVQDQSFEFMTYFLRFIILYLLNSSWIMDWYK